MTCTGVVQGNVVVLEPGVELPEGVKVEVLVREDEIQRLRDIAGGRVDPLNIEARREAARAPKAMLSPEERAARVEAAKGFLAGGSRTVDDFLREKHEETERGAAMGRAPEAERARKPTPTSKRGGMMACKGTVRGNVVVLEPEANLPDGLEVEVWPAKNAPEPPDRTDREAIILAARSATANLTQEERVARVRAALGSMKGRMSSVDEFIRAKQEEIELEDRRWMNPQE